MIHRHTIIYLLLVILSFTGTSCMQKLYKLQQKQVSSEFEQMDFQGLAKLYMSKETPNPIEGIYTVSGVVTKKGTRLLGDGEREKILDRKENYAKVAIIRDPNKKDREFIEVSLDKEGKFSYSIVGEFTSSAGGSILIYKHFEAKEKVTTFTFTADPKGSDLLEGIRVDSKGNATYTYKLTYVKLNSK